MEQKFYFSDDFPQPMPKDMQEVLKKEAIQTSERPPQCTCASKPDEGCVC